MYLFKSLTLFSLKLMNHIYQENHPFYFGFPCWWNTDFQCMSLWFWNILRIFCKVIPFISNFINLDNLTQFLVNLAMLSPNLLISLMNQLFISFNLCIFFFFNMLWLFVSISTISSLNFIIYFHRFVFGLKKRQVCHKILNIRSLRYLHVGI